MLVISLGLPIVENVHTNECKLDHNGADISLMFYFLNLRHSTLTSYDRKMAVGLDASLHNSSQRFKAA